jgi:hypothetical protein
MKINQKFIRTYKRKKIFDLKLALDVKQSNSRHKKLWHSSYKTKFRELPAFIVLVKQNTKKIVSRNCLGLRRFSQKRFFKKKNAKIGSKKLF